MFRIIFSSLVTLCLISIQAQNVDEVDFNLVSKGLNAMDPSFSKGSARYSAMAGSMGAIGGDVSAVNNNPATGGIIISNVVNLTMDYGNKKNTNSIAKSFTKNEGQFEVNQFGGFFSFPINRGKWQLFNLGLLYDHQNLDNPETFGKDENLKAVDFDAQGNVLNEYDFYGYVKQIEGYKSKFTINLSTNYDNKLYLGMNINFHSYNMDYSNNFIGRIAGDNTTYNYEKWGFPYSENADGLSLGIGGIYRPFPALKLGAAFQSPITWNFISTEYDQYYYNENTGLVDTYVEDGLWEEDRANSAGFLTLSTGVVIKKSFALNFDFFHYLNSSLEYKPSADYLGTNNYFSNFVKSNNEFRIGGEYRYKDFSVRAGYGFAQSPMRNVELENGYYGSEYTLSHNPIKDFIAGKKETIGFGFGYNFDHFQLDFAYQNRSQSYHTLLYGTHVIPGDYPLDVPYYLGKVDRNNSHFILTLGYSF